MAKENRDIAVLWSSSLGKEFVFLQYLCQKCHTSPGGINTSCVCQFSGANLFRSRFQLDVFFKIDIVALIFCWSFGMICHC